MHLTCPEAFVVVFFNCLTFATVSINGECLAQPDRYKVPTDVNWAYKDKTVPNPIAKTVESAAQMALDIDSSPIVNCVKSALGVVKSVPLWTNDKSTTAQSCCNASGSWVFGRAAIKPICGGHAFIYVFKPTLTTCKIADLLTACRNVKVPAGENFASDVVQIWEPSGLYSPGSSETACPDDLFGSFVEIFGVRNDPAHNEFWFKNSLLYVGNTAVGKVTIAEIEAAVCVFSAVDSFLFFLPLAGKAAEQDGIVSSTVGGLTCDREKCNSACNKTKIDQDNYDGPVQLYPGGECQYQKKSEMFPNSVVLTCLCISQPNKDLDRIVEGITMFPLPDYEMDKSEVETTNRIITCDKDLCQQWCSDNFPGQRGDCKFRGKFLKHLHLTSCWCENNKNLPNVTESELDGNEDSADFDPHTNGGPIIQTDEKKVFTPGTYADMKEKIQKGMKNFTELDVNQTKLLGTGLYCDPAGCTDSCKKLKSLTDKTFSRGRCDFQQFSVDWPMSTVVTCSCLVGTAPTIEEIEAFAPKSDDIGKDVVKCDYYQCGEWCQYVRPGSHGSCMLPKGWFDHFSFQSCWCEIHTESVRETWWGGDPTTWQHSLYNPRPEAGMITCECNMYDQCGDENCEKCEGSSCQTYGGCVQSLALTPDTGELHMSYKCLTKNEYEDQVIRDGLCHLNSSLVVSYCCTTDDFCNNRQLHFAPADNTTKKKKKLAGKCNTMKKAIERLHGSRIAKRMSKWIP